MRTTHRGGPRWIFQNLHLALVGHMEFGALVNLSFTYPRPLSRAGPVQCGSNPSSAPQPVRTLPTPDTLRYPPYTREIPSIYPALYRQSLPRAPLGSQAAQEPPPRAVSPCRQRDLHSFRSWVHKAMTLRSSGIGVHSGMWSWTIRMGGGAVAWFVGLGSDHTSLQVNSVGGV